MTVMPVSDFILKIKVMHDAFSQVLLSPSGASGLSIMMHPTIFLHSLTFHHKKHISAQKFTKDFV